DRAEHIHLLGESLAADGNLAAAEQRFREAIRKRPDYAPALRSLAQSRMRSGSFGEACRLLRQARRLDPGAAAILEDLGAAYLRLNYLDSAAAVADTLLAMESRSPGGHLIRMLAAVRSGDEATARRHFLTYREHGRQRPEYAQIVSAYGGLAPDR
ncbi:MAG TPA: tetratricopeptide repeat protein, partial [candidate division Zixibacteria bacterium]|nr:tetratricopeptide repeat protein [candidate division Zixibacteria bacterium]